MSTPTPLPSKEPVPITSDPNLDVAPRYLAGPGSQTAPAALLVLDHGWSEEHVQPLRQRQFTSPDRRLHIATGTGPGAWWQITAAGDSPDHHLWSAVFSQNTPEELVAAAVTALPLLPAAPDQAGEVRPPQPAGFDSDAVLDLLRTARWRYGGEPHGIARVESPDYLARAELRRDARPGDLMGACALVIKVGPGEDEPYWQARLTTHAPPVVVEALVRAVVDPAPVRRSGGRMGEHLLAHLGFVRTEAGLEPARPAYTDDDITRAAARSLSDVLASADGHLTLDEVLGELASQPLPSTAGCPGPPMTWGELPDSQRKLAAQLALDLVMDSARYSNRLFGLDDGPSRPLRQAQPQGRVTAVALADLAFTTLDLRAAAGTVAALAVARTDDPSGILEGSCDEPIASRADEETQRHWHELPDHLAQPAYDEICRRFTAAHETVAHLFAPGMPTPRGPAATARTSAPTPPAGPSPSPPPPLAPVRRAPRR